MNPKTPYARYGPSEHHTMVFNTFVLMILFNMVNSRRLGTKTNIFSGLGYRSVFVWIWVVCFAVHVVIIQFGGYVFFTRPLDYVLWAWSLFLSLGIVLWRQVMKLFHLLPFRLSVLDNP
jgi:hypothetical protein